MLKGTPWEFKNEYIFETSSNKKVIIKYLNLMELGQGGPLKGNLEIKIDGKPIMLKGYFGGPPLKVEHEDLLLIPKWKKNFLGSFNGQELLIFNLKNYLAINHPLNFKVIQIDGETDSVIQITDSPNHNPRKIELDLRDMKM